MISITGNLKDIIYVINLSEQSSNSYTIDEFIKQTNEDNLIHYPHNHKWLYITRDYNEMKQILANDKLITKLLEERGIT